jgi:hypothetical protein
MVRGLGVELTSEEDIALLLKYLCRFGEALGFRPARPILRMTKNLGAAKNGWCSIVEPQTS